MVFSKKKAHNSEEPPVAGFGSWGFKASAAVLAFVLVLGMVVVGARLLSGDDKKRPQEAVTVTATSPGGPSEPPSGGSSSGARAEEAECPAAPTGTRAKVVTAPKTTWDQFGGGQMLVPRTDAGPAMRSATVRRCFARTHLGAMTAVANVGMALEGKPAVATAMIRSGMTDGEMRRYLLANEPGTEDESKITMRVVGVKTLGYTPSRALMELVVDVDGAGTKFSLPTTMVWSEGDWKIDGGRPGKGSKVTSLDGVVQWEPGR